jgi:hypothetical protein
MSGFLNDYGSYIFPVLGLLAFGHLAIAFWRAARQLRARGLPVRPSIPDDALFGESKASGHLEGSFMTRMSGASNCLMVWVTRQEFVVDAVFPFNLLMYLHASHLRVRAPIHALISARQADARSVLITYPDAQFKQCTFRLFLKHPDDLVARLKSLNVRAG